MNKILRAVAFSALCAYSQGGQGGQVGRPNFILMMADDLGWGDTHYNGHRTLLTPNLDAMAAAGVHFRRFHSQSAVCSPTRGSVLTGRHPDRYGVTNANVGRLEAGELTLAEVLRTQGYRTGHFGKWHLGTLNHDADFPDGQRGGNRSGALAAYSPPWENGFDACFSTEVQMPSWNPMVDQNYLQKYWTGPGQYAKDTLTGDDSRIIMDRALPFIETAARARQPFFAVIWFHAPHKPYRAGPEYLARYAGKGLTEDEQHYFGAITALDEQVGRLRTKLKELGLENTLLAFTSDNGPENGTPGSTGGLKGRKHAYYEGGIRVPGLLEWPARIRIPFATDYVAVSTDYYPTFLEVLNLQIVSGQPLPLDGASFLPALSDPGAVRAKPIAFNDPGDWSGAIAGGMKIVRKGDAGSTAAWEMYDLDRDIGETINLAADSRYQRVLDSLKRMVGVWGTDLPKSRTVYPKDPLLVKEISTGAPARSFGTRLRAPAFDGVYNVQGRDLRRLQREAGGTLLQQAGRTYLIRNRK